MQVRQPLLVGGKPVTPERLTQWMIEWVVSRVIEREGSSPSHVTLTYPANWTDYRRDLMREAAVAAGATHLRIGSDILGRRDPLG